MFASLTITKKIIAGGIAGVAVLGAAGAGAVSSETVSQAYIDTPAQIKGAATKSQLAATTEAKPTASELETKMETATEVIPFESTIQTDPKMSTSESKVVSQGVDGERVITYKVTYQAGKEVSRENLKAEVTKEPVKHVTKVGSKVVASPAAGARVKPKDGSKCHPSYTGACVPITDKDVDCESVNGVRGEDGPVYVKGPVTIVDTDFYGLDGRIKDGKGCE